MSSAVGQVKVAKMRIVTQLSPDLDACLSVWLLRRFGGFADAELGFVSTGNRLPEEKDKQTIYVDTSGGKYDHHHTNEPVCAASLVLQDLKLESDQALKRLVDFTILVDHGLLMDTDLGNFNLVHIMHGLNRIFADAPEKVVEISGYVFDSLYAYLSDDIQAQAVFEKAVGFETRWGPGIGVVTSNRQVRYLAHQRGYKVYVHVDPQTGFRGFESPGGSGVDFTEIYERIRQIEPDADWFLHSSKELLLCGSPKAPDKKLSNLPLKSLVSLVSVQGFLYA